jgi:DNA-binding transcriptional LysR family regulator
LASIAALESSVRPGNALSGTVRLGAVPTVCQGLLPDLLATWSSRLPGVVVHIYEGDDDEMPDWVEAGVVDAAILVEPSPAPSGGRLVATDEFCAVIRTDHPLASLAAIPLAELLNDGLIVSAGGCEGHVSRMYATAGLTCSYAHKVREISTLFHMVEQGLGVAIVPSLGRVMLPNTLTMKPLEPSRPRHLVLSGPASRPWHPLAQALVDAI